MKEKYDFARCLSFCYSAVSRVQTAALAQAPSDSPVPSDAEIRKILADRIGAENLGIGIVVGVVDPNGRRVVAYGSLSKDDKRPLNGDTVFEIGSMTKVFTSLVLMDMVQKGEVSVTDPVSKYLPESVKMPERNNRKITLQDLSTQSSGLPGMPTNFNPKDPTNPYADYSVELLYQFLSGYQLTRDIGSQYEYSNLGVGLLGHALALRAGTTYEGMVRSRICAPLGMNNTRVTLSTEMKARLAIGHGNLNAVPNWDFSDAVAGAGALRSTANDILTFLAANLGMIKTPLATAMAAEVSIRRPTGIPDMQIAYAWHVQTKNGNSIIGHGGGTGGYRTYMGFDPKSHAGIVVLSNYSSGAGPDDIGRHLLDTSYALIKVEPIKEHKEVTVDSKLFDKYIGSYQLGPNGIMAITRDGNQLFEQLTGPKAQLFPEGERKFFLKVVDAQISFDTDAQGKVTQLVLHWNGKDMPAKRLDEGEAAAAVAQSLASRDNLKLGVQAFQGTRYSEAVEYFKKAVELDPEFPTARLYLATAYMSQYIPGADSPENKQYAVSAMEQFNLVLKANPKDLLATQSIANIYFQQKDWDKAEEWNRKVVALDPSNKEAYYTLGVIPWTRFLQADRQARVDMSMKPEDPGPLKDKKVRAELKEVWMPKLDAGIAAEKEALKADPDYENAMAYMNLLIRYRADLLDSPDEYKRAVEEADEWVHKTLETQKKNAEKRDGAAAAQKQ
jgi:serine-type D-Ala-D-Ala carboxypeptidase/endopeptidase